MHNFPNMEQMLSDIQQWKTCVWDRVSAVAGYEPPSTLTDKFNAIFNVLRPSPDAVEQMEHVREGLVACHYHLWNVTMIQQAILSEVEAGMKLVPPLKAGDGAAGGNSRRLDFEYQALLLALRRVLEYLARAVERFFHLKIERGSYGKGLANRLRELTRTDSDQISCLIETFCEQNPDLVGERAKRNRLAHKEALRLGTLNIGVAKTGGLRIVLGGELFSDKYLTRWDTLPDGKIEIINPISEVMQERLERTEQHVFSVYSIMIEAIKSGRSP